MRSLSGVDGSAGMLSATEVGSCNCLICCGGGYKHPSPDSSKRETFESDSSTDEKLAYAVLLPVNKKYAGDDSVGFVMDIEAASVKALVIGDDIKIIQDDLVTPTGTLFYVPVGENLQGCVVGYLGNPDCSASSP